MEVKIRSEKKQNIKAIVDELKKIKIYDSGAIDFNFSFEYEHLVWMLLSIIDFKINLAPSSKKRILVAAIAEMFKEKKFEEKILLSNINKHLKNHLRKKEKTFFLLGTLSIESLPFRKLKLDNSTIFLYKKSFPKRFKNQRREFLKLNHFDEDLINYYKIVVEIDSKNLEDAFLEAIEKFEVLRSILCLFLNKDTELRYNDTESRPINLIGSGEVFTLHDEDGLCPDKICWTADNYRVTKIYKLNNDRKDELKKKIPSLFKKFNLLPQEVMTAIQKALNVYTTAFDEKDKHLCLLKAWTVLEILLNTDQNDEVIKRIVAIFHDDSKSLVKQDLECLRVYRNEYVHSGNHYINPLIACFRLQKYIRHIINYHLKLSNQFKNMTESINFLDTYGLKKEVLVERKKIIDKALQLGNNN